MPNKRCNRRKKTKQRPKNFKPKPSDIDKMIQEMNSNHSDPSLIKFAVYMMERQVYGPDHSEEFVFFCLSSYFILKNKYSMISHKFDFFPKEMLENIAEKDLKFFAGISNTVVKLLKIKTENYDDIVKTCVLMLDDVALKPELQYCDKHEYVVGFEDNGKVRTNLHALYVTNIWVRCTGGLWVTPFAYYFTNKPFSADILKEYIFEAVTKLNSIGLDVIGLVTKMKTNFYELAQNLNISTTNQTFKVGNKDLVFLFDVPQLMNITRNNMMYYKIKFDDKYTSWKYVKEFFVNERQGEPKTKLTLAHIKPDETQRFCLKFAIELLSHSVSSEMKSFISLGKLPQAAVGTAEFIDMFNKLFDILNSSNEIAMNEYCNAYKGNKNQVKFMEKAIKFFEGLKVYDNFNQERTDELKFISAWLVSIKAVMKLWEILNNKHCPFLPTSRINCEPLDYLVCMLRWQLGIYKDPTPISYLEYYSSFFISSYFEELQVNDSDFDIYDFAKKIYKRIPPIKHDITDKTTMPNNVHAACESNRNEGQGCSTSQQKPDVDIFGTFVQYFMDRLNLD